MSDFRSLRTALRINAGFSTASGIALLGAPGFFAATMGLDARLPIAVGVGLLAFAAHLVFTSARSNVVELRNESRRHALADFAWVLASAAILTTGWLTPAGDWLLAAVAVPVLALGIVQWRALPPHPGSSNARPRIESEGTERLQRPPRTGATSTDSMDSADEGIRRGCAT